jgi:transposase
MMGRQRSTEPLFHVFCLEDHVPPDHPLRQVDRLLDLGFVREGMARHYSSIGRPSIDPELMIRMLMIGYLQGIRSERRLVEEVHLNLAYRWFCRLGLDGRVPERSTFSKNRHGRFAEGDLFRTVFEDVVRRCAAAGIVPGESAAVDGSFILADASPSRRVVGNEQPERWGDLEVVTRPVREYLSALDAAAPPAADEPRKGAPKYLSATDPAAAWSNKHGPGRFGYETNYHLVDTAYGVIVDVEATPARLSQEIVAAKAMLGRAERVLGRAPHRMAADQSYGTGPFLAWLLERKIEPYIPVLERKGQTKGKLTRDAFSFDPIANNFTCPEGKRLTYQGADYRHRVHTYRTSPGECTACRMRASCTDGRVRTVVRLFDETARDQVRELAATPMFGAMAKQRRKVEMLFAHLKQHLGLRRLKLRGLSGAREEFLLAAAAQNLRRLVKLTARGTALPLHQV